MAKQTPQVLAVGDHIRLKARDNNQHQAYRAGASEVVTFHEPVDGLVLSIRDVRSGPDGYLYLLTDASDGVIARLEPAS